MAAPRNISPIPIRLVLRAFVQLARQAAQPFLVLGALLIPIGKPCLPPHEAWPCN